MNALHCVWSTYLRKNLIPEELEQKVWAFIKQTGENHEIMVLGCGGTANHAHALIVLPKTMTVAKAVQTLKSNSSRFIESHGVDFDWQEGYGAFSVSQSQLATVKRYIASQKEHHRKRSFEEEFIAFLKAHKVDYDPRYVFG
jgi:REP element-mobilizing transposase RayT